jgi:TolB-like protein
MKNALLRVFFLCAIIASFWQCSHSREGPTVFEDGKEKTDSPSLFRHRWWNYYQRGLSYSDGQYYQEAIGDFEQAILQRAKDQRMARTYGMHFVDYFPRRELGVVHFRAGNPEEAERYLKHSIEDYSTAKARYYLDLVRKAIAERSGGNVTPPILTLDVEQPEQWTSEDLVVISGEARDDRYVAAVSVNGRPIFLEGSERRVRFEQPLALPQGKHTIEIEATNLLGVSSERRMVVHVDRDGPVITVEEVDVHESSLGKEITIRGFLHDDGEVSEFHINGQAVSIEKGQEIFFRTTVTMDASSLDLVAEDRLGNRTSGMISLASLSSCCRPVLVAGPISDVAGNLNLMQGFFGTGSDEPPLITLRGWADQQTVFLDKIYLEGQVTDENKIEALFVNEVPILRRKGHSIVFGHVIALNEGSNLITVEARDGTGQRSTRTITVTRCIPKARQLDLRLSISVFPFEHRGAVSEASFSFFDHLIDALVDRNRFRVVERNRLDLILQEQKISASKLIAEKDALHLGRLLTARSVMTGTIVETRSGVEIVARMIDTETSEVVSSQDVYMESKDPSILRTLAEGMAIKFHRDFPLLDGLVVERKGKHIFTDLGEKDVKLGRRLIVYREKPVVHPVTGKALGADNEILDYARIVQVSSRISKARLAINNPTAPEPMDGVVTE